MRRDLGKLLSAALALALVWALPAGNYAYAQTPDGTNAAIQAALGANGNTTNLGNLLTANANNPAALAAIADAVAKTGDASLIASVLTATGGNAAPVIRTAMAKALAAAAVAGPVGRGENPLFNAELFATVAAEVLKSTNKDAGMAALGAVLNAADPDLARAVGGAVGSNQAVLSALAAAAPDVATDLNSGARTRIALGDFFGTTAIPVTLPNPQQTKVGSLS
jgi:hypothetical protein